MKADAQTPFRSPSLLRTWLFLMALSLATLFVGAFGVQISLGPLWSLALLVTAFVKMVVLMNDYMGLRAAPAWNSGLRFVVFLLMALLGGLGFIA